MNLKNIAQGTKALETSKTGERDIRRKENGKTIDSGV